MLFRVPAPAAPASSHPAAAHSWSAHSGYTDAAPAEASTISVGLVILEQNGIDDGVGSWRRLDRGFKALLAAHIHSIREHDHCLAPRLLRHHFVRSQEDCVIEQGSCATVPGPTSRAGSRVAPSAVSAGTGASKLGRLQRLQCGSKLLVR